ncbi:MAG: Gfo/Idh/MocA family oxidoreductase, partial [Pseudomonadota bacterium]
MKKIIQNFKTGETSLVELPAPACSEYSVLIETKATLISIGTERMLIEFGKGNLIEKARQQPDKVKQVLQKVKTDGVAATVTSVQSKLDQPIALGYCNAGIVREVGAAVTDFAVGDRVVSNGGHAEFVSVATNLCAKIPDNVSDEEACFTVAAAIGLQGVRLAEPTLGEQFVVIGLGLIGLLTTQLLLANGCEVLGVDFDQSKCDIAQRFGAKTVCAADGSNPVSAAKQFSDHKGVDGVIITASTKSSEPLSHAANMCRQRGRVVLIGVIGNEWSRADFYEKEISLQVSCSYGPGRYDLAYEELGQDYPRGFVRWTEQRNFEAILQLMSSQSIDTAALISHRYDFEQALEAYDQISGPEALGVVLQYTANTNEPINRVLDIAAGRPTASVGAASVGVIGAGNFSSQVLLPALASTKARLHTLASEEGLSSTHHGRKHGFEYTTTDKNALISNPGINTVFITTRHGNHAELVSSALAAGKNVFVEKPLAINQQQLDQVRAALDASNNE